MTDHDYAAHVLGYTNGAKIGTGVDAYHMATMPVDVAMRERWPVRRETPVFDRTECGQQTLTRR